MNYIMICLDSLRQDHIGAYDGKAKTPNMDRLAQESAVFSRMRSESLPTVPVRNALSTGVRVFPWEEGRGRYKGIPIRHKGWLPLHERDVTIAEHLLERDYVTGMVIDTYHLMKPCMNFHRGMKSFNFIRGQEYDHWKSAPLPPGALDRYVPDDCPKRRLEVITQYMQNQQGLEGEEGRQPARVFAEAMEWLEGNAGQEKFYLWVDSFDPHEPWDVPQEFVDLYDPGYEGMEWIYPNVLHYNDMTDAERQHCKALYAAEVTLVDKWLGKFLDKIDELGLRENTLVVLLSDHGKIVGERNNFGMDRNDSGRFLYDVPLMVRHPEAIGAGQRFDQWVYNIDVTATALDVLGEEPMRGMDGQSFWPLVTGEKERLHDYCVCSYGDIACVWQDDFIYLRDGYVKTDSLYNAWEDPEHKNDLSEQMLDAKAEMAAHLDELLAQGPH